MGVQTRSFAVPFNLVSSSRAGYTSVLGQSTDPFDAPGTSSYSPSWVWHWQATLPAINAAWIALFSSIVLHAAGPTQEGLLDTIDRGYFYDGNPTPADGVGWSATPYVYLSSPATFENGPWLLFDQPSGTPSNWEEFWLTECFTASAAPAYNQNARSGPAFEWLDPFWRASIGNNAGHLAYLIAPYPTTVDYWLVTPGYWFQNGRKIDASYTVLDERLIVVACQGPQPGVIDTLPAPDGVRPRGRILGNGGPAKL